VILTPAWPPGWRQVDDRRRRVVDRRAELPRVGSSFWRQVSRTVRQDGDGDGAAEERDLQFLWHIGGGVREFAA